MSFGWLGTFRQGSWQAFRRFVLEERRDVAQRISVIEAELTRIGEVTVLYQSETDDEGNTTVSEERRGFSVSAGSSLGKLLRVYTALGGNPFDISLFLRPDKVVMLDSRDPDMRGKPFQPYGGVVYPKRGAYTTGDQYEGGFWAYKKYVPARIGGPKEREDYSVGIQVATARKWVNKEIRYKRNDIEARILKLCDLREQLMQELEDIVFAVGGQIGATPFLDDDQFDKNLTVAGIVAAIDSIFYDTDDTGRADFDTENTDRLGNHPYLLSDESPEEDNTAL